MTSIAAVPDAQYCRDMALISLAGPVVDRYCTSLGGIEHVAMHESAHAVVIFLLKYKFCYASVIQVPGRSLGHIAYLKRSMEELMAMAPQPRDWEKAEDRARTAGTTVEELFPIAAGLVFYHWPMVRALAADLLARKQITGRRARQILYRAQKKQLRRALSRQEQDRRNRQNWERL